MKASSFPILALVPALLLGCWSRTDTRPVPTDQQVSGFALDTLPLVELELPDDSRDGSPPPPTVPLTEWALDESDEEAIWRHALPVRPRALRFLGPPRGLWVLDETGRNLPYASGSSRQTWTLDEDGLAAHGGRPGAPAPSGWAVESTVAQAREARLNWRHSGLDPEAFTRASLRVGATTRRGLLLPAPATAAFDVDVPAAAELHLTPGIVPPEARDLPASDGATLEIEVEHGTRRRVVRRVALQEGVFEPLRVDLSRWAGQRVRVRLRTLPGAGARYDYVLVADPIVAPRKVAPRRVVLVFVDTLRQDHLGTYGYDRPTSPKLDAWAEGAAIFTDARSVAPWTLPSYRSAMTGAVPSAWRTVPTLPERLRESGWATAMFAGNVYLSSNFDGDVGWGDHYVVSAPSATEQVDRSLAWLAAHSERDALLLVHFMDPHLPYEEPEAHRERFSGPHPDVLPDKLLRSIILRHEDEPGVRDYVRDRYDNNIRFVDDELGRLFEAVSPEDLVVLFSDHGEELWDHGSFEHGHTLFDELLRVPLIVRGPGVTPGRFEGATSLLDIVPSVVDWLDRPAAPGPGVSLLDVAAGEIPAGVLDARALPVGNPLYGLEQWGVVRDRKKYRSLLSDEHLHDLVADPTEQTDVWADALGDDIDSWRASLAAAHGGELGLTWRVSVSTHGRKVKDGLEVRVRVPGGIDRAWPGEDRRGAGSLDVRVDGDEAVIVWPAEWRGRREAYVRPSLALDQVQPMVRVRREDGPWTTLPLPLDRSGPDGNATPLVDQEWPDRMHLRVGYAVVPVLPPDAAETFGYSPELEGMLEATGYAIGPDPQ